MIEQCLKLLGTTMRDRVTDIEGMVSSVSFDVYGCVQATLTRKVGEDGKKLETYWFDIKRLESTTGGVIMPAPPFTTTKLGDEKGPASKPAFDSPPAQ